MLFTLFNHAKSLRKNKAKISEYNVQVRLSFLTLLILTGHLQEYTYILVSAFLYYLLSVIKDPRISSTMFLLKIFLTNSFLTSHLQEYLYKSDLIFALWTYITFSAIKIQDSTEKVYISLFLLKQFHINHFSFLLGFSIWYGYFSVM